MAKYKVTDGDLIILTLNSEGMSDSVHTQFQGIVAKWLKARGLSNCDGIVLRGGTSHSSVDVTILSVNDVFEDQVLNGKTKD